jgi:hypothetical protein
LAYAGFADVGDYGQGMAILLLISMASGYDAIRRAVEGDLADSRMKVGNTELGRQLPEAVAETR